MSLEVVETDDGGHYYTYDGRRVLGVSEILDGADTLITNSFYEERRQIAAVRGKEVHLACQDLDRGYPDWWTEDQELAPYVQAYRQFKSDFKFSPEAIELPMFHDIFHYAGTPDRSGKLIYKQQELRVTLDLKAVATIGPHVQLQLGGYNLLHDDHEDREMLALQLKPTGKYHAYFYTTNDRHSAQQVFLACLTLCQWKRRFKK